MKICKMIPACLTAVLLLTACGSEQKEQYKEAEQNLDNGHYEEALEGFEQAVSDEINVAEAYRGQGIALLKMGRYEEAIKALESAISQDEGSNNFQKDIWLYKADAEYKSGNVEQALVSVQAGVNLSPDAGCYTFLGKIQLDLDQYDAAKESFSKAIEEENTYQQYIDIYQIYVQNDMKADGETYLNQALELDGNGEEDYYQRGRIYFFMGDNKNARKELMESSNKGYPQAMLFLGKVYLADKDSANARAMYQQYLNQEEDKAMGYNGLALCDIEEGNYDSALENIQLGLEAAQTGDVQELMYNEVVAYEKKLDFATARTKMEAYLQLYPEDEAAQKEYEFLQYR